MKKVLIVFMGLVLMSTAAQANAVQDLGKIVVTSQRAEQPYGSVGANVTVLTQQDIAKSTATTLSELLREQPGIFVNTKNTEKTSTIDMRGFGDAASRNVLILVNDRRINPVDISGPDLVQVNLDNVERIEIIRGGASVLYGDNAVGGAINIVTKKGKEGAQGSVSSTYGSYGTHGHNVTLSGAKDDWDYYVFGEQYNRGGYRLNSDLFTQDYVLRLGNKYFDKLHFDLEASYHDDSYGLPGGLGDQNGELETLGRRASAHDEIFDYADAQDGFVKLSSTFFPWDDKEKGKFQLDYSYRQRDTFAFFNTLSFGAATTKRNIETHGLTGKYIYDGTWLSRDVHFVGGFDVYDFANDILGGGSGVSKSNDDLTISKEEFGVYVNTDVQLIDALYGHVGARYQEADYTFDRRDTVFFDEHDPNETVFAGGLRYQYAKDSNVFFKGQETFRFLATDEWYSTFSGLNTSLRHQTGNEYQIGIKHNHKDYAHLSLTGYIMKNKNEIFFDPSLNGGFGTNGNYDRTRRVGVEYSKRVDLLHFLGGLDSMKTLDAYGNVTVQEAEFDGGNIGGNRIPFVPEQMYTLGVASRWQNGFGAALNGRYIGSRFAVNDTNNESTKVKPYVVVDAKLSYQRNDWETYLSINNILDERYHDHVVKSASGTNKDYYPAPERNFLAGVKVKF